MANTQHDDFGEKIGGAKKDLWKERGLFITDLDEMNSREADKYVKKDNVWKKPDYDALIAGGVPLDVAFFIKTVRDSLGAAPQYLRGDDTPDGRLARQKQYIETVREIKAMTENIKTQDEAMQLFSRLLVDGGYIRLRSNYSRSYALTEKGMDNPVISNKLFRTLQVTSPQAYEQNIALKAVKEQFGVPKDHKIPKGYEIHLYSGNGYSKYDDWTPGTFFVTKSKSHRILAAGFESKEAALAWIKEQATERRGSKKRFAPEQLAHVRRIGADYREGRDASGDDFLSTFGFRGGEFGNWMNQHDRLTSLNMGFDALKDLSDALNIKNRDVSYGGSLAIAFGARGSGSAVAHYEPMRKVINLTKMRGAGSLAHEWWHGFDDFLGQATGAKGFLSENPRAYPSMAKLIETMKYKPETREQATARTLAQDERIRTNSDRWIDRNVGYAIKRKGDEGNIAEYERTKESFLNGEAGAADKLNELKKSVSGHVIPKEERTMLSHFEHSLTAAANREEITIGRTETDFYKNSKKIGSDLEKDGGYWDSNTEMTARAFATYIKDRLPGKSDYLAGHAECAFSFIPTKDGDTEMIRAYPYGEERRKINDAFDDLISDLKRDHHLTHEDKPVSKLISTSYEPVHAEQTEQISLPLASEHEKSGSAKPSVIEGLAAAKEVSKISAPIASDKPKSIGQEI